MKYLEVIVVACILLSAIIYLCRILVPNKQQGAKCGCGKPACKVRPPGTKQ